MYGPNIHDFIMYKGDKPVLDLQARVQIAQSHFTRPRPRWVIANKCVLFVVLTGGDRGSARWHARKHALGRCHLNLPAHPAGSYLVRY